MTINRYRNRNKISNNNKLYKNYFDVRDVNLITQYGSPKFNYDLENVQFETVEYIWKFGDRLSKLAEFYFGDPTLWWIISFVNQKPTENHFKEGDLILIPISPDKVLQFMGL